MAAFLGLLWPRLNGRDPVAIAVVAALATIIALPLVPPGIPVLIAAAVTAGWWAWRRRGRAVAPMSLWIWVLLACGDRLPDQAGRLPAAAVAARPSGRSTTWPRR